MKTIWKYDLDVLDKQKISMPEGSKILTAHNQFEQPCIWVEVDPDKDKVDRLIEIFGTGHPMPVDMGISRIYIGTVFIQQFVWHLYERL